MEHSRLFEAPLLLLLLLSRLNDATTEEEQRGRFRGFGNELNTLPVIQPIIVPTRCARVATVFHRFHGEFRVMGMRRAISIRELARFVQARSLASALPRFSATLSLVSPPLSTVPPGMHNLNVPRPSFQGNRADCYAGPLPHEHPSVFVLSNSRRTSSTRLTGKKS